MPPLVICAASQVGAGKVQGMHKEYTCILEVAPAEMEFDQVKILSTIARVFLDFCWNPVTIIGIRLASFECYRASHLLFLTLMLQQISLLDVELAVVRIRREILRGLHPLGASRSEQP